MKRLRIRVALLAIWLVLFYTTERISGVIDISDTAYLVVLVLTITILLSPQLSKIPFWLILIVSVTLFLIFKGWKGDLTKNTVAALSIFEVTAVLVTTTLAYWLSLAMAEFENTILQITIGRQNKLPEPDSTGQGFIYREVRRARNHQRPLALIAIGVNEKSLKLTLDRMVHEVQLSMMKQYKLSGLSKTLCDELEDCAIIVQQEDHFLIALPETKPEEVPVIVDRLRKKAAEQAGIELEIGAASLTKDSFTYDGLIEKAMNEMRESLQSHPLVDFDRVPSDHPVTADK